MAEDKKEPIYVTVGFKCQDQDAFNTFWQAVRENYHFAVDNHDAPTQAFAVSMGNMFEEQDVIDAILESDLGSAEMVEAISGVTCNSNLAKLCEEWEIPHPYAKATTSEPHP